MRSSLAPVVSRFFSLNVESGTFFGSKPSPIIPQARLATVTTAKMSFAMLLAPTAFLGTKTGSGPSPKSPQHNPALRYLKPGDLSDDVVEGVVEPLVEGDGAVVVDVHGGEVLLALGQALGVALEHFLFGKRGNKEK